MTSDERGTRLQQREPPGRPKRDPNGARNPPNIDDNLSRNFAVEPIWAPTTMAHEAVHLPWLHYLCETGTKATTPIHAALNRRMETGVDILREAANVETASW